LKVLLLTISIFLISQGSGCRSSHKQGELVVMLEKRIETFDPRVSSDSAVERMRQLIFNGLTRKNDKFDPVPDLAERYESSPDYKTFTFYLRPNVRFHDGRALSAVDVKYTFNTMMATGFKSAKRAELERDLASIESDPADPLKVTFRCNSPCPGFANTVLPVGIIPEQTSDQQAKRPVGTGPFKFESYSEDQEVILSAYNEYFE